MVSRVFSEDLRLCASSGAHTHEITTTDDGLNQLVHHFVNSVAVFVVIV